MSNQQNNRTSRHKPHRNSKAALRETRRKQDDAHTLAGFHDMVTDADRAKLVMRQRQANQLDNGRLRLKITPLGGQDGIGEKNMIVIEYGNDAIVTDVGHDLSVGELPGINFAMPDITYLESIKHKVRGYIFTHGHLDHIGAVPYIVPSVPAPLYGTRFTMGMVEKQFTDDDRGVSDFTPETIIMNSDSHEKLKVGPFFIELVRVTHAIPDCAAIVIDTPEGKIINTGDFRLDPEPLDHKPSDINRLKQLGEEGVLLLLSESVNTNLTGRTPTEHTLQPSFDDIFAKAQGRVLVASFSSNINRVQMIINSAVQNGRKVVIDGRSMLAHVELSVKLGFIKIPHGTIVPMNSVNTLKDRNVTVICTGGQGEMNAALQRMSIGSHTHLKIKPEDTVVISSTPIPGNEVSYQKIADDLVRQGARVFSAPTHEADGCGPLHVSGHARREEYLDMIRMTRPKFFVPIYGGARNRRYHIDLALEAGIPPEHTAMLNNGDVLEVTKNKITKIDPIPSGSILVDQTGAVVPNLVVKDRLLMSGEGIVVVVLTVDKRTKQLLTSPDIISRGFIHMQESMELVNQLRDQIRDFAKRRVARTELKQFKQELRDEVNNFLYLETQRSPVIIPVVNAVEPKGTDGSKQGRTQSDQRKRQFARTSHQPNGPKKKAEPNIR